MGRFSPLFRISLGLVLLTCSILVGLDFLGFVPDPGRNLVESRIQLCETLAVHAASAADRNDLSAIRETLQLAVRRNEEVLSAGLRARDGRVLVSVGPHRKLWEVGSRDRSTHASVPLFRKGQPWGTVEVRFDRVGPDSALAALWERPLVRLLLLVAGAGFVAYGLYMQRTLKHLDPSAVIPARVQAALDVMAEGVLLLDPKERIVLANAAFAERVGVTPRELLGVRPSSLRWSTPDQESTDESALPWMETLRSADRASAMRLLLRGQSGESFSFSVKSVPVQDGEDEPRGVMVTFDDVTELDRKSAELRDALADLEKSQYEIQMQNEELLVLSRRDPLTDVSNRRAFMEKYESVFVREQARGGKLACVMCDLDHFKRVNDRHGHSAGDEVIRRTAEALLEEVGSAEAVCRYGGEEFCLLLEGAETAEARKLAERLRRRIESPGFARVRVTASFGVSSRADGARTLLELINKADEALYASKSAGRNTVTAWSQIGTA